MTSQYWFDEYQRLLKHYEHNVKELEKAQITINKAMHIYNEIKDAEQMNDTLKEYWEE